MIYNKNENTLRDKNIYIDKKNRLIYYRPKTKQGFVIAPGTEQSFYNFSQRFIYAVLAAIFFYLVVNNYLISAAIGIITFAFLQYKFTKIINTYPMIQNFDLSNCRSTIEAVKPETKGKIILKFVLYMAVSVLLVLNLYYGTNTNPDLASKIVSYIASIGALFLGFRTLVHGFKK